MTVTIRADRENREPQEIVDEFHGSFVESLDWMGITMDLYSHLVDGMQGEAADALDSLLGAS